MEVVVIPHSNLPVLPVSNNMPGVQPNKLENLDDLLAEAEHYAGHSMRNRRKAASRKYFRRRYRMRESRWLPRPCSRSKASLRPSSEQIQACPDPDADHPPHLF